MAISDRGAGAGSDAADVWEVSDDGVPPMRLTTEQVLALIAQGRLGWGSQARRVGDPRWARTASCAEFGTPSRT